MVACGKQRLHERAGPLNFRIDRTDPCVHRRRLYRRRDHCASGRAQETRAGTPLSLFGTRSSSRLGGRFSVETRGMNPTFQSGINRTAVPGRAPANRQVPPDRGGAGQSQRCVADAGCGRGRCGRNGAIVRANPHAWPVQKAMPVPHRLFLYCVIISCT